MSLHVVFLLAFLFKELQIYLNFLFIPGVIYQ